MKTIWVSGAIANKLFNGGEAWTRLSYVVGLQKLGFDVYFVEQIDPANCVDDSGNASAVEASANLAYFRRIMDQFGLSERSALFDISSRRAYGRGFEELLEMAGSVALLVNISGHLSVPELISRIERKAYIDLDPGFTQFWHEQGNLADALERHDFHFTVGENIGNPSCSIPTGDIDWRPTRQPVVLDQWPVSTEGAPSRFTTIANWRGPFGPVVHRGKTFGLKVHQFRKYIELPSRAEGRFEIALNIHPNDRRDIEMLQRNSWRLADPRPASCDPGSFRRYIQTSGAEFSAAQNMYVDTNSGWFSDRTVRYLASGKPALVEDTGWTASHPCDRGLVTFSTLEEAIAGADDIVHNYSAHARAARGLAESVFQSDRVLGDLLAESGVGLSTSSGRQSQRTETRPISTQHEVGAR